MGYLLNDHTLGTAPDGGKGIKQEWDTRKCRHCGGIVKSYVRRNFFNEQLVKYIIGPARQIYNKKEMEENFWCNGCNGHLCRACGIAAFQGVPHETAEERMIRIRQEQVDALKRAIENNVSRGIG